MNWLLDSSKSDITVGVKDELAINVIEMIDVPRGSFMLDPYTDSRIPAYCVSNLIKNIQIALSERIELHRSDLMRKLHLSQWPLWAENMLQAEEAKDSLLGALEKLNTLCTKAMELDCDIIVFGD